MHHVVTLQGGFHIKISVGMSGSDIRDVNYLSMLLVYYDPSSLE